MVNQRLHSTMQKAKLVLCFTLSVAGVCLPFAAHSESRPAMAHHKMPKPATSKACATIDIHCAKTATLAVAPNGDLWRLWSQQQAMYFQISTDQGKQFLAATKVNIPAEKISARNENRPKIAFDNKQGVYLSWAMPREKKYTADIRFSYSSDYGKTFSKPVTVNNDNLLAGHSFNELLVNEQGDINIVWLDGRLRDRAKGEQGSAIFLGKANMLKQQTTFTNQALANGTCVCCRIAIDENTSGNLAVLWRHIYGDNIREFALLTVNEQDTPHQVSFDHWKINGCPHQGGGLSIDDKNRYHMVWFNLGDKGKGPFYARSQHGAKTLTQPLALGDYTKQAAHPHISAQGDNVDIIWTQYNGVEHQLWYQKSTDAGNSFNKPTIIATSTSGSDRPFIVNGKGGRYVSWHRNQQGHWITKL